MEHIQNIIELYAYVALQRTPSQEDFDIVLFSELAPIKMMPPHRRDFCTIIFIRDQKTGQININEKKHQALSNILLFQSTAHVFSFVRNDELDGMVLLFKKEFLLPYIEDLEIAFPFFNALNQNLFHLSDQEYQAFQQLFDFIYQEQKKAKVTKPLLLALLEKAKLLYATYTQEEQFLSPKTRLVRRYKALINNYFMTHKGVDQYASLLNITPNYLNEVVKSETGNSAKKHINERVLLEAKNLLLYADLTIAEISHLLQFSEPTHFTKFFKKETGLTPKAFQVKGKK